MAFAEAGFPVVGMDVDSGKRAAQQEERVATNFHAMFDLPEALRPYVPDYAYSLVDLSAYRDEDIKRSVELGIGLLVLKHIFRPELRDRLPEVLALWYTMRHQPHALGYLEAILRYILSAGQGVSAEDVRMALAEVAPEGDALMGTIAQELIQQGLQQGEQQRLPVAYKGHPIGDYVADIVVNNQIILELKAVSKLTLAHEAQAHHYLAATGLRLALLLNFGADSFKQRRVLR